MISTDRINNEAVAAFVLSTDFVNSVRRIDKALSVTESSFLKVPFDVIRWRNIAAEEYPHGLPKPESNDPTQWVFNGHPTAPPTTLYRSLWLGLSAIYGRAKRVRAFQVAQP